MKVLTSIVACLLISRVAVAQTYCVRQGGSGSGDGTSWTNAFTDLPSSLVRGATYYVAGGSYAAWNLNDAESGTSVITIRKATVSDHGTSVGWSDSYASSVATIPYIHINHGYYTIDGAKGGGPGSWESGFGFQVHPSTDTAVVFITATTPFPTNIMLRHMDLYGTGDTATGEGMGAPFGPSSPRAGSNNMTVSHCYFHNMGFSDPISLFWQNNVLIEYNEFEDVRYESANHSEPIKSIGCNDVTVRYNRFIDIDSTGVIVIFEGTGGQAVNDNFQVYGNIVYATGAYAVGVGNGFFGQDSGADPVTNAKIYNNTFYNLSGGGWGIYLFSGSGNLVYNNLWVNSGTRMSGVGSYFSEDYNTVIGGTRDWALNTHDTSYASGSDPFVDPAGADFRLSGHTDPGIDVSSLFAVDMLGNAFLAAQWDRGALAYTNGSTTPPNGGSDNVPKGDIVAGCACNAGDSGHTGGGTGLLLAFAGWYVTSRRRRHG